MSHSYELQCMWNLQMFSGFALVSLSVYVNYLNKLYDVFLL